MKRRRLGRTGLEVTEVGFGGAGLGHAYGKTTDAECVRAVHRALDLGVNFFDTSPIYGTGKSEENLGAALLGRREQVVLASKARLQTEDELDEMEAAIRRSVENSLQRLRTDWIDVLQIHHQVGEVRGQYQFTADPPRFAIKLSVDDALKFAECTRDLVKEGKVRFVGLTGWDGERQAIATLIRSGAFDCAQILYNVVNQTAVAPPPQGFDDIDQGQALVEAQAMDVGVIGIRSHAAGALVDELDREVKPDSDVARDHQRAATLAFMKKGPLKNLSQVALRFCLDHPAIATVVPGFKNASEVEEAIACTELPPLAADDIAELQRLYRSQFKV